MKIYHLADLHFGKSIYGLSMLDDQRYWTEQFLKLCKDNKPDAVMIAGDVYDRSAPSGDAVSLLDYMITELAEMDIPVEDTITISRRLAATKSVSKINGETVNLRQVKEIAEYLIDIHAAGTVLHKLCRGTMGIGPCVGIKEAAGVGRDGNI